jgi:hypothetical protein
MPSGTESVPYVDLSTSVLPPRHRTLAAYAGMPWILESNIELLPPVRQAARRAQDMLLLEARDMDRLGTAGKQAYENHALSLLADGKRSTWFASPQGTRSHLTSWQYEDDVPIGARKGDYLMLDAGDSLGGGHWSKQPGRRLEMTFLIPYDAERLLRSCTLSVSSDAVQWVRFE